MAVLGVVAKVKRAAVALLAQQPRVRVNIIYVLQRASIQVVHDMTCNQREQPTRLIRCLGI